MSASSRPDRLSSAPSTGHHIGGLDANPIEQLHARTVQRILKEYPEYSCTQPTGASVPVTMSSPKKQTMTWDAPTDQKLLLAVLAHYGEMKIDYEVLASMMGPHCSPRAVQERIKKLRKDAKAGFDSSSPTAPATAASPAKTKTKAAPSKAKNATRGKRGAKAKVALEDAEEEEADGGEEEETKAPARKKRKYMEVKAIGSAPEPIGRELAEEMGAAYDEAV